MRFPDFLLIGAAKSGTTALFHYLGQHPEIFPCPVREPNYFALADAETSFNGPGDADTVGRHSVTGLAAYHRLFEGAGLQQKAGEVSPLYLYHPDAPARIAQHTPKIKLIVILRHPIERAYASFLHLRRDGREPCADFQKALALEPSRVAAGWEHLWHYHAMGFYTLQLERYFARFDRSQLKIFLYEDLVQQPAQVVKTCFDFLALDSTFLPDFSRQPNRSGIPRSRWLQRMVSGSSGLKKAFVFLASERQRAQLRTQVQRLNLVRPAMDAQDRLALMDVYRHEILALQELIDRDLSSWLAD